jgi:hypothetical protein
MQPSLLGTSPTHHRRRMGRLVLMCRPCIRGSPRISLRRCTLVRRLPLGVRRSSRCVAAAHARAQRERAGGARAIPQLRSPPRRTRCTRCISRGRSGRIGLRCRAPSPPKRPRHERGLPKNARSGLEPCEPSTWTRVVDSQPPTATASKSRRNHYLESLGDAASSARHLLEVPRRCVRHL